jgi:acyl CoA:acetate/3-ketoacid CoA transferase alpha subunit
MKDAVKIIQDGDGIGCGGFSVSRCPTALVHEIIRQKKRNLTLYGTNLSFQMDLLVGAGCVSRCESGTGNLERFGVAYNFRRACEKGTIEMEDHSHLGMASRFLAGEMGLPFMPLKSWLGSDIINYKHPATNKKYALIEDPFNLGKSILLVPALNPDVSIIHAQQVDEIGNVIIKGCTFHELEMVRASKKVIVTCEEIISSDRIRSNPELTTIPNIYVSAVVKQPWGAHPTSVYRFYDYDAEHLNTYQDIARANEEDYDKYLNKYILNSDTFNEYLKKIGGKKKLLELKKRMKKIIP